MSEFAQQRLERLIPVFEELQRVQLLTNDEVKGIIKTCKSFEHKLEKLQKEKDDYVKYIQYLIHFLGLIRERREEIKYFYKRKEIEYAIAKKIDSIFRLVCDRFQADVDLWMSRIEFAKTQQWQLNISRTFSFLLQKHTDKPHLWIAAAKWEFEENGSPESARRLLQRGLRFNSDSQKLYLELFRLELLYVDKLKQRQEALGSSGEKSKDKGEQDENNSAPTTENATEEVSDAILEGKLAQVVFQDAAEKFEGNVELCVRFAKIAKEFSFAQNLVNDIYDYIDSHYENMEERWAADAERQFIADKQNIKPCLEIFEKAVVLCDTAKMWRHYLQFCLDRLEDSSGRRALSKQCLDIFARASKCKEQVLDEDLYKKWIELRDDENLRGEITEEALSRYPKSACLWECSLKLKIATGSSEKEIMNAFNRALQLLPEKETLSLWILALNWATIMCWERVDSLFKASLKFDSIVSGPLKIRYLKWIFFTKGLDAVRSLFRELVNQKPNSFAFYLDYYDLELAQVKPDVESVRHCLKQAAFEHGQQSPEPWLKFAEFELKSPLGDPGRASKIYNFAVKRLEDDKLETFKREYMLLTKN